MIEWFFRALLCYIVLILGIVDIFIDIDEMCDLREIVSKLR